MEIHSLALEGILVQTPPIYHQQNNPTKWSVLRRCAIDVFDHVIELFLSEFEAESKRTPSGVFDSSDIPQVMPYADATCKDNDSVASTSANPYLSPEAGDFLRSFKHILEYDVKPTSSWPTQFSTPHDHNLLTCRSTDLLPGGFDDLILGSENEGVWVGSCGLVSGPLYYLVDVLGDFCWSAWRNRGGAHGQG
jgi:hypothetical protein